jgi:hypothetical protein
VRTNLQFPRAHDVCRFPDAYGFAVPERAPICRTVATISFPIGDASAPNRKPVGLLVAGVLFFSHPASITLAPLRADWLCRTASTIRVPESVTWRADVSPCGRRRRAHPLHAA